MTTSVQRVKCTLQPKTHFWFRNIIHEKQDTVLENEYTLNAEDIYKELAIVGYDYSGEFKGLKSVRTHDLQEVYGICEWSGKLVTFLDALFQSMICAAPFRKLMVPVMIRKIRIDPKTLFEACKQYKTVEEVLPDLEELKEKAKEEAKEHLSHVPETLEASQEEYENLTKDKEEVMSALNERFCFYKSEIPFYFNVTSKLLVTHGIEVEEITAFPIPRKADVTNLVLDSYEFVNNEDNCAVEEYDRNNINEYLEVNKRYIH